MDPITVAGMAGTALVGAMVTDAWQQTRDGVVALWRRVHPERAEDVGEELTRLHTIVDDRQRNTDVDAAMAQLWQLRLRDLLLADPALTAELTARLARLTDVIAAGGAAAAGQVVGTQHLEGHASDGGRVYQAARDITITER
ncbi:hypothetical protein ACFRJ7_19325 [Streptomyces sp. NPDC056747]|uniref:hypothetical protein n=1 Tax=Streptomyces sp. NPDC056747 TaxID=3345935 RepID=UPI0036B1F14F